MGPRIGVRFVIGVVVCLGLGLNSGSVFGQGETCDDCISIAALPYADSGMSCSFIDDYDAVCPYTSSISPDVVYCYYADVDQVLDIDLCTSAYDTKVFVYEDVCSYGDDIACNDDACGVDGYRSELIDVEMTAGHTYYIVIDGYGGDCGEYELFIGIGEECIVECLPGATPEGEPVCSEDYNDTHNAGCGAEGEPVFGSITCGETICAEGGTYIWYGSNMRDTDWFTFYLDQTSDVVLTVEAEFPILAGFLAPGDEEPCVFDVLTLQQTSRCEELSIPVANLEPGMYWAWAGASEFMGWPCGSTYNITLDCTPSIGACCFVDFTCEVMPEADCIAAEGAWLGAGTGCEECPDPVLSEGLTITEVVDGNLFGGIPKWVELTNRGSEPIDLINHSLGSFNSGNDDLYQNEAFQLEGTLLPGESFVFEYDNPVGSRFEEVYGFLPDRWSEPDGDGTSGRYVNGDDAIALFLGVGRTDGEGNLVSGQIVDIYGVRGVDGTGEIWEYADGYSCRLPGTDWPSVFDPEEWYFGGVDSLMSGYGEEGDIYLLRTLTTPGEDVCAADPCAGQLVGDANCDGVVNNFDIDAFVLALTEGEAGWQDAYGGQGCTFLCVCDMNDDDAVNNFDIDPFVDLLTGK